VKNKSIDTNVSVTRIAATLMVLMIHTCSTIVTNPEIFAFTRTQGKFLYVLYRLNGCAVPLFLMISGRLILSGDKQLTYPIVFTKYVKRILLALAVFSIPLAAVKA